MKTVSIGYRRDDGDFRILATLNNNDDEVHETTFDKIVRLVAGRYQDELHDDEGDIFTIEVLEREDTPDYVDLDEDESRLKGKTLADYNAESAVDMLKAAKARGEL